MCVASLHTTGSWSYIHGHAAGGRSRRRMALASVMVISAPAAGW